MNWSQESLTQCYSVMAITILSRWAKLKISAPACWYGERWQNERSIIGNANYG